MKQKVDLIVHNAKVYTVNKAFEIVESFAVQDGRFVAVDTSENILLNYTAPQIIDAEQKAIFPGFIDAHCHFYGLGITMQQVDLVGASSEDDMLQRIVAFQAENNATFILGRGWDQTLWTSKTFPTKEKLNQLFPNTPVAVNRIDGHAMLANDVALEKAGITSQTKVAGGEIEVKNGKLTGILLDNAMNLVYKVVEKPSKSKVCKALNDAQEKCFSYGITSVHDADLKQDVVAYMRDFFDENKLKIRIYAMVFASDSSLDFYLKQGVYKTEKLNIGAFKMYIDGALGSRGALLKKNYEQQDTKGVQVTSKEDLFRYAKRIQESNFQLNVHAIGDAANYIALSTFVDDLKISKARRWRVEHAQIVDALDFKYFETILPSVQPTHVTSDMYWAEKWIGHQRIQGAYANKELLNRYSKIALGTDFPIEKVSPFLTFYAAVARKDINGFPEGGFQLQNALSRQETLKGMTIWAAYAAFEENEKGSIEVGKLADFVLLNQDIMTVAIDKTPHTKVLKTFLGGEEVYSE